MHKQKKGLLRPFLVQSPRLRYRRHPQPDLILVLLTSEMMATSWNFTIAELNFFYDNRDISWRRCKLVCYNYYFTMAAVQCTQYVPVVQYVRTYLRTTSRYKSGLEERMRYEKHRRRRRGNEDYGTRNCCVVSSAEGVERCLWYST